MKVERIEIAKTSGHKFAQDVHPWLPSSEIKHLIGHLRPASTRIIDVHPAFSSNSEHIDEIVSYLVKNGIPKEQIKLNIVGTPSDKIVKKYLSGPLSSLDIDLGADVAERDLGLSKYFISTSSFRSVEKGERHVIVGPKGAGKTAILSFLQSKAKNPIVINPEYYATDLLNTISKDSLPNELSVYIATWKYSLLVEIMQNLVKNRKHNPNVRALRQHLVHNGLLSDFEESIFEKFMSYLRRFSKVSGGISGNQLTIEVRDENDPKGLFRMTEILDLIPSIRKVIREHPVSIYIDELDQSWDNSITSNNFLIALFTAAIQLRSYDENFHVFIFLRSEIFELLKPRMGQLDKFRLDIVELYWTDRDLKSLIESRISSSLGIVENIEFEAILDELFTDYNGVLGKRPFEYILSRTTYRPREVIQFTGLALDIARRAGERRVTGAQILLAEEQFSEWKIEHLVSENMFIYPKLGVLLEQFRTRASILSGSALAEIVIKFLIDAKSDAAVPDWIQNADDEGDVFQILYDCDILGILENNVVLSQGRLRPEDFYFRYRRPKAKAANAEMYMIHPALWKSLQIVSGV